MTNGIEIKREININTIAIIVGFLVTFASIVFSYSNLQNDQRNFGDFIVEQKAVDAKFEERFAVQGDVLNNLPQIISQIAQLHEGQKNADDRLGRVTESYSNQFADIRLQLGAIGTQVALVKQSLDRIEAWRSVDRDPVARQR